MGHKSIDSVKSGARFNTGALRVEDNYSSQSFPAGMKLDLSNKPLPILNARMCKHRINTIISKNVRAQTIATQRLTATFFRK